MGDYLTYEYDVKKRPVTSYPDKLAEYLFKKYEMKKGNSILEIGAGRCELLAGFKKLGLNVYAFDSAPTAKDWAQEYDIFFELGSYEADQMFRPFNGLKFDYIFSKSFIEHINTPVEFAIACKSNLSPKGKHIILTPDFEANYRIFYDDITHVKPFTTLSMIQLFELAGYADIKVDKFRQLPSTWNSRAMLFFSKVTSLVSHHRAKSKWLRWSRELMISGIGVNSD